MNSAGGVRPDMTNIKRLTGLSASRRAVPFGSHLLSAVCLLVLTALVFAQAVLGAPSVDPAASVGASAAIWERILSQRAPRPPKGEPSAEDLFWTGVAHANLGRIEESRKAFERLGRTDPERTSAAKILDHSRGILSRQPDDLEALNGVAFVAYAQGDFPEAARMFRAVVQHDPRNPWARSYLGFSLGKGGHIDEAVTVLEEGVRTFPKNEVLHFLLGVAYYEKGQVLRALLEMAKAPTAVRYFY